MRKTSHDDTSSITSGIDNESKKSATNFNKMKKSSLKRKVQNFSHESDDGIIEPLLQSDNEKKEIAARSAKYLLNKSKTESLHEKDNKVVDGFADKCSIPLTSSSYIATNVTKDKPISTSYICGSAPIHNHMNTNIFNAYDAPTGLITTKSPILVEIETSKSGSYSSPSPLIFTTAKIHSDNKTKVMEPVQVTPVPILSTIEGNIVKAGMINNTNAKSSNLSKILSEDTKNVSGTSENKALQNFKEKSLPETIESFSIPGAFNSKGNSNKNETTPKNSLENAINLPHKDLKLCQLPRTDNSQDLFTTVTQVESYECENLKGIDIMNAHKNDNILNKTNQTKEPGDKSNCVTNSKHVLQKYNPTVNKSKDNVDFQGLLKKSKIPIDLKSASKSNDNEVTTTDSGCSKTMQRQKKAAIEQKNVFVSKNLKLDIKIIVKEPDKHSKVKSDKAVSSKLDDKISISSSPILPRTATNSNSINTTTTAETSKGLTKPGIKPTTSTKSVLSTETKSIKEKFDLKSASDVSKDVPKSTCKSSVLTPCIGVKDSIESIQGSIKAPSSVSSSMNVTQACVKSETMSPSTHSVQTTNANLPSNLSTVNITLPSYIVSTSKTKIGSTMVSCTPAITSKPQTQKPLVNISTTSETLKSTTSGAKLTPTTSTSTKYQNISKQSKSDAINKDGRI